MIKISISGCPKCEKLQTSKRFVSRMVHVQRDCQINFQVFYMADIVCMSVVMDTCVFLVLCSSFV